MILSDFIKTLQTIEATGKGNHPVVIADWSEQYNKPSEESAEDMCCTEMNYFPKEHDAGVCLKFGTVVCIGSNS